MERARGSSERARGSRSGCGAGAGVVGAGRGSSERMWRGREGGSGEGEGRGDRAKGYPARHYSNGAPPSGAPLVVFFLIAMAHPPLVRH